MSTTQIEILKLLTSNQIPEKDLAAIKQLIIQSLTTHIDQSVNQLFEENNWDEKKINEWSTKHLRTPYQ